MSGDASAAKSPFVEKAELVIKLGTALLGLAYVLGLLVSNVQLGQLGISDFTSLEVRTVMTGFLFLYYSMWFLVAISIPIFAYVLLRRWRLIGRFWVWLYVVFLILTPFLIGMFVGSLCPWGEPLESKFSRSSISIRYMFYRYQKGYSQFWDAFGHVKIVEAAVLIAVLLLAQYRIHSLLSRGPTSPSISGSDDPSIDHPTRDKDSTGPLQGFISKHRNLIVNILFLVVAMESGGVLLVGFAEDVYPNIEYYLGGGQPVVASLQISADKSIAFRLPGIAIDYEANQSNTLANTEPILIWYQSDKFLYVAPLSRGEKTSTHVIALDVGMVRTIRYLPESVRVGAGGQIVSVIPGE
jgi:hypothetical protein